MTIKVVYVVPAEAVKDAETTMENKTGSIEAEGPCCNLGYIRCRLCVKRQSASLIKGCRLESAMY